MNNRESIEHYTIGSLTVFKKGKTMNNIEAFEAMKQGKKVRMIDWYKDEYLYLKNGVVLNELGYEYVYLFSSRKTTHTFEVYDEPKVKKKITLYRPKVYLMNLKSNYYFGSGATWVTDKKDILIEKVLEWETIEVEVDE